VLYAAALCTAAVAVLLWAEWRQHRPLLWAAKILASTSFVLAAISWGALTSLHGRLVVVGLALSWVGDVLLIPRSRAAFVGGLGAFLLAHLAYAAAFARQPLAAGALALGAAVMAAVGASVLRWLWPHLRGGLRPAVACYVGAISLMVAFASGAAGALGATALVGAIAFAVSDVFVARHRFVTPSIVNKLWGLPLYYAGQLLLAATVR
jgi:uncharacterized membrane protein YhhN